MRHIGGDVELCGDGFNSLWEIMWEWGHITTTSKHLEIITSLRFAGN